MMDSSPVPALSAAVVIGDRRERAQNCLDRLLEQTIIDRIEIVVVDLGRDRNASESQMSHPAVRRFHRPALTSMGQARAEAARQSRADVIAFLEDHTYADRRWAEEVLQAFSKPVDIVNYAMRSANRSALGRMFTLVEYGRWMDPAIEGPVAIPACQNIAYRRAVLRRFWDRLDRSLDGEILMCRDIQAHGSIAWLAAHALVEHESWARIFDGVYANSIFKRLFASERVRQGDWGPAKRVAFAAAMVATPPLHIARLARSLVRRPQLWPLFFATLPLLSLVSATGAVAEAAGYLFDERNTRRRFLDMEVTLPRQV